jgi:hypothetical protein
MQKNEFSSKTPARTGANAHILCGIITCSLAKGKTACYGWSISVILAL